MVSVYVCEKVKLVNLTIDTLEELLNDMGTLAPMAGKKLSKPQLASLFYKEFKDMCGVVNKITYLAEEVGEYRSEVRYLKSEIRRLTVIHK
jgi:hypothetical protein